MPENTNNDQVFELQDKLRGHQIFGQLRGQSGSLLGSIDQALNNSTTPTEFCTKWDDLSAQLRVIGNLMATLKRDGKTQALEVLRESRVDRLYIFPGETVPLEKIVPVTLVMFDPKRTLAMVRWILECHWMNLDAYLGHEEFFSERQKIQTSELFQLFPSLEKASRMRHQCGNYEGWELGYAYQVDVLRKFVVPEGFDAMAIGFGQYNDHFEISPPFPFSKTKRVEEGGEEIECLAHFLFLVQANQKDVLSHFTREEQENIATWQFRTHPESLTEYMTVGMHLDVEHERWQSQKRTYASLGVSNEFGAIINPPVGYPAFRQSQQYGEMFRVEFRMARL